jgi:hypothetical protein
MCGVDKLGAFDAVAALVVVSLRGRNLTSHGYRGLVVINVGSKFDGKKRILTAKTCEVVQ